MLVLLMKSAIKSVINLRVARKEESSEHMGLPALLLLLLLPLRSKAGFALCTWRLSERKHTLNESNSS